MRKMQGGLPNSRHSLLSRPNGYQGSKRIDRDYSITQHPILSLSYASKPALVKKLAGVEYLQAINKVKTASQSIHGFLSTQLVLTLAAKVYRKDKALPSEIVTLYERRVQRNLKEWAARKLQKRDHDESQLFSED